MARRDCAGGEQVKERSSVNEINKVCKAALKLTDEDFSIMESVAKGQAQYFSPLRMATAGRQHALAEHNFRVLAALKTLRELIKQGTELENK
jgi:hypothetical protein